MYCVFFFSSRRRHTRLQGDWSSDVCSSDLHPRGAGGGIDQLNVIQFVIADERQERQEQWRIDLPDDASRRKRRPAQIGRAAWRGRVEISVGAGSLKKKKKQEDYELARNT